MTALTIVGVWLAVSFVVGLLAGHLLRLARQRENAAEETILPTSASYGQDLTRVAPARTVAPRLPAIITATAAVSGHGKG